jgi:hypothetical protein
LLAQDEDGKTALDILKENISVTESNEFTTIEILEQ